MLGRLWLFLSEEHILGAFLFHELNLSRHGVNARRHTQRAGQGHEEDVAAVCVRHASFPDTGRRDRAGTVVAGIVYLNVVFDKVDNQLRILPIVVQGLAALLRVSGKLFEQIRAERREELIGDAGAPHISVEVVGRHALLLSLQPLLITEVVAQRCQGYVSQVFLRQLLEQSDSRIFLPVFGIGKECADRLMVATRSHKQRSHGRVIVVPFGPGRRRSVCKESGSVRVSDRVLIGKALVVQCPLCFCNLRNVRMFRGRHKV